MELDETFRAMMVSIFAYFEFYIVNWKSGGFKRFCTIFCIKTPAVKEVIKKTSTFTATTKQWESIEKESSAFDSVR